MDAGVIDDRLRELILSPEWIDLARPYEYGSEVLMGTARVQKTHEVAAGSGATCATSAARYPVPSRKPTTTRVADESRYRIRIRRRPADPGHHR